MLASQKDAIAKITGIITSESINELENQLGGPFTILKSSKTSQASFLSTSKVGTMSTKSSQSGVYEMLASQKDAIAKITGIITPESIDELKNELRGAFTILKSTHFDQGQCYGHLAIVIPKAKYRVVIADPTWVYAAPADPGAYAAAALAAGVSAARRDRIVAQHKVQKRAYADYLGAQEAGKELLLLYGVGYDALALLKNNTSTSETRPSNR
jgi:hypothetical protein